MYRSAQQEADRCIQHPADKLRMTAHKHHCLNEALEDGNIAASEDLKHQGEHTETEKTSASRMMVTYIPW